MRYEVGFDGVVGRHTVALVAVVECGPTTLRGFRHGHVTMLSRRGRGVTRAGDGG